MAEQTITERKFRTIEVERHGPVCTVTLSRPPLNIIDLEMMGEIHAVLHSLDGGEQPSGVGVLVFRGSGKCFSAGVSIQDHTPDKIGEMIPRFHYIFRHLARTEMVTVAAVHGACLGGGMELAAMCDLVVAADNAQFGQPEIKLGQLPPVGIILLPYLVGYRKAAELVLAGNSISAAEALALGLVNRVVPQAQLQESLDGIVRDLTAGSPNTLRLAKSILRRVDGLDFKRALDESERFFLQTLAPTEDAKEGIFAFLEKRAPRWKGR